ncbi:PAS [Stigmatella aurantiaca DW4/3-1]|uniref:histidine kinase n=1 Tax=Stigmatella aurantiaca (strain DW4/3-1) TaxID=378806 RepID=Q098H2_STIAD|nr:PAS [Stigmatella aurantiaca DW4/3-1]
MPWPRRGLGPGSMKRRRAVAEPFKATILNVNDDSASRYVASRILEMGGYRVIEASTGQEALKLAAQHRPDLVILDVQLPDILGYEVASRLRASPDTASISVLHTSATFVTPDKRVQGLDAGADGYLTQPFEPAELIATVRSLLRLRHAERELRVRADQLTAADRRKDEFLAMLAHELRNPLAAIMTAIGILERKPTDDVKEARMRAIIQRQTHHLARLVDDLLDVSRITRGKVELRRERMDTLSVLQQVLSLIRPTAEGRGLSLESHLPGTPLWVEGDSTRLEQIFMNLLDNAAKYTDAGGHITVHASQEGVGRERPGGGAHPGHGHRHPQPQAARHLRAVRPGGRVPGALPGRPRHRADPGAQPGGAARRHHWRHQRWTGPRQRVRGEAARGPSPLPPVRQAAAPHRPLPPPPHPPGGRQLGRAPGAQGPAGAVGAPGAGRSGRDGGSGPGAGGPSGLGPGGHRTAGAGWIPRGEGAEGAGGPEHPPGGHHGLRRPRGSLAGASGGVRPPHGQAGEAG